MRKYGLLVAFLASCSTAPKTVVQTPHQKTPLEQFVEYRREQVGPAPDDKLSEYEFNPDGEEFARLDDQTIRAEGRLLATLCRRWFRSKTA